MAFAIDYEIKDFSLNGIFIFNEKIKEQPGSQPWAALE